MKNVTFLKYWSKAKKMTQNERDEFFSSFSKTQQRHIKRSYYNEGWKDVFFQNIIENTCDKIKSLYNIDLLDLRIKITRKNHNILIKKDIWDDIRSHFSEYEPYCDLKTVFGGISSKEFTLCSRYYRLCKTK